MSAIKDTTSAADAVIAALEGCGRKPKTIAPYRRTYRSLIAYLEGSGANSAPGEEDCLAFLNKAAGTSLASLFAPTDSNKAREMRRPLALLVKMLRDGEVDVTADADLVQWRCPTRFAAAYDGYMADCAQRGNAPATIQTKRDAARSFFDYLEESGVESLDSMTGRDLAGYVFRNKAHKRKTVASTVGHLRDFLAWGSRQGAAWGELASSLPKVKVVRNEALPYLWSPDEVRAVLAAIDRSSAIGKRDYAMILLVARLGLRTTDLRMLEFSAIDWRAKTLTVVQHKTGVPLKLPLLDDVGWAIVDYLRNGRPETGSKLVFVKHRYPFDEIGATGAINCRLYRYAAMAGIEFPPGRPHSMHSFRSSLARAMVGRGTPLPAVSQVLGHADTRTTMDYYLRLDAGALRECALDIEDVIGGGVDG